MKGRRQVVVPVDGGWRAVVLDEATAPVGIVVVAHDLLADRTGPARAGAKLGAALAEAHVSCLRFDFAGAGDSSGRLREATWEGMTSDVVRMCGWATDELGPLPLLLVGLGIGAVPVLEAAGRVAGCRAVVLLDSDLQQDVRYVTGPSVFIKRGQWHLPEGFFREREALRPRTTATECPLPVAIAYGVDDPKAVDGVAKLSRTSVRTVPLPGGRPFRDGDPAGVRSAVELIAGLLATPRVT